MSADVWASVKVECEPSWQPFQGHCYRLQTEKRSWQDSKKACLRGGGDLLSIHSLGELEFISKRVKQGEGGHAWPWEEVALGIGDTHPPAFLPSPPRCPQRWRSSGLASTT